MKYNGYEKLSASGTEEAIAMTKGRKTTYEERVEIVKYCIENEIDFAKASEKYQIFYKKIYQWARKYQANGVGLIDKRGKRKPESEMSELEKLCAQS